MKGFRLLLAVCLAPLTFGGAMADDNTDAARAAVRRAPNNSVAVTRQKSADSTSVTPAQNIQTISRATNLSAKSPSTYTERERTTSSPRGDTTTISSPQRSQSVTTRAQPSPQVRTRTASQALPTRTGNAAQSRSAITRSATTSTPRIVNTARTASTRATLSRAATQPLARAADTDSVAAARTEMMSHNAKKCREVYYNCMDEFCANKDAVLKRCACSSRIHEFDSTKKNLANVEDKMLEFNQRLLTVNMDKEDAEALYKATEGELAFNQKDTSQSKKMLDEIAKKLNTSFDDSNFDRSLSPISLSLNVDAAFDSIDSLQGASTTLKSGTELYTAALPVCREMAREVCTDDDLTIAESGYQMVIEQDCNTVAKSYQAQVDQARERVREGGALLDMSRLDIHQKRNSDDTLTCKKKMLDMLTDSSVCGTDMGKCLDVTGKYIDPSTGEAFLTENLKNLNELITRPSGDQTWSDVPSNKIFVSYLNSKKKFLEPAMENCQDIANTVWTEFLEDALAQIKLAQESKLEDMRQSCTTITTKCLSDTAKSLADFDARALSIFGVKADKTVTAMCADVTNACNALLDSTVIGAGDNWSDGMKEITNANTYETILSTCREVGRACIVQVCSSTSGNFGLCESIQSSVNRKSIINRTACWDEVVNCISEAGDEKIAEIMKQLGKSADFEKQVRPLKLVDKIAQITRAATPRNYSPTVGVQTVNMSRAVNANGTFVSGWAKPLQKPSILNEVICVNGLCEIYAVNNDFYDEVYITPPNRYLTDNPSELDGSKLYVSKFEDLTCTTIGSETNKQSNIYCIYDMCSDECNTNDTTTFDKNECYKCRIAEKIWGNCEANPKKDLVEDAHNRILQPRDDHDTLLWWFAKNTGTSNEPDSCRDTTCPAGYKSSWSNDGNGKVWTCFNGDTSITQEKCTESSYNVTPDIQNCCDTKWEDQQDAFENCLPAAEGITVNNVDISKGLHFKGQEITPTQQLLYIPTNYTVVTTWNLNTTTTVGDATYPAGKYALICANSNSTRGENPSDKYPSGQTIRCVGKYVIVYFGGDSDTPKPGLYFTPGKPDNKTNIVDAIDISGTSCYYSLKTGGKWSSSDGTECAIQPDNWEIDIKYKNTLL